MSMIIQELRAEDFYPSVFEDDEYGVKLDENADFCLDEGEEILEMLNFHKIFQTSRMTKDQPHLGPDSYMLIDWTLSFTQKRVFFRSPYALHNIGLAVKMKGKSAGGYLRYSDIASLSATNYTHKEEKVGRIEICSRGNTDRGGVEIFTIISSADASVLAGFAKSLTDRIIDYWGDRIVDDEIFRKGDFKKLLGEFASLDWQTVIEEKDYLKGLGLYKDPEGKVWARWREVLPPPPKGMEVVFRNIFETRETLKAQALFLVGKNYERKEWGRYYGEE